MEDEKSNGEMGRDIAQSDERKEVRIKIPPEYNNMEEFIRDIIISDAEWKHLGLNGLERCTQRDIMNALKDNIIMFVDAATLSRN